MWAFRLRGHPNMFTMVRFRICSAVWAGSYSALLWLLSIGSSISKITCGLSDILAGEVIGQRLRLCCRVSQIQQHQYLLIFRKAESLVELVDVHAVQPAGLHSCILCSEHEMSRHYGRILYARLTLSVRVGIDIVSVESHDEDR